MNDCSIATGQISISNIPFLKDYGEVKKRLSIRLWNKKRIKTDAVTKPFLDFGVTCHIDLSDLIGTDATCIVKEDLLEYMGVEEEQLFSDAIENSMKTRPAVAVPIEEYLGRLAFLDMEAEHQLMLATTEQLMYGAGVILYPGFLERISCGKKLLLIPSSVHEWLYLEDDGTHSVQELTDLLKAVNRDVVAREEVLSNKIYYFDGEMRRA